MAPYIEKSGVKHLAWRCLRIGLAATSKPSTSFGSVVKDVFIFLLRTFRNDPNEMCH